MLYFHVLTWFLNATNICSSLNMTCFNMVWNNKEWNNQSTCTNQPKPLTSSLKITNGQSENVNRIRIDNIIAKKKQWSKNTTQEPKDWATQTTHNTWDEFRCSGRVRNSCSTEIRNSFSMIKIKRMTVEALISKWAPLFHIRGNCCLWNLRINVLPQ